MTGPWRPARPHPGAPPGPHPGAGVNDPFTAAERAGRILADDVATVTAGRSGPAVVQRAVEGPAAGVLVDAAVDAAFPVVVVPPPSEAPHRHGAAAVTAPLY